VVLAAHRQSPNFAREQREKVWVLVERLLGPKAICGKCGATFKTFEDKCEVDVADYDCPGTRAIAAAEAKAKKQLGIT
jgi:hypothetical protein